MRQSLIAGIVGLILGHVLWLISISIAIGSSSVSNWVLVISGFVFLAAAAVGRQAWQRYQRRQLPVASFLAGLLVSPVLFTFIVLGVTYL